MTAKDGTDRGRPPKHGAYSGKELIPLTREKTALIMGLMAGTSLLVGPTDSVPVELLARNLAKIEIIDRWLQMNGLFADKTGGVPWPVLKIYWQAVNSAARMCDALGLTPQSRVRLGIGVAGVMRDMGAQMQEMKEEGE